MAASASSSESTRSVSFDQIAIAFSDLVFKLNLSEKDGDMRRTCANIERLFAEFRQNMNMQYQKLDEVFEDFSQMKRILNEKRVADDRRTKSESDLSKLSKQEEQRRFDDIISRIEEMLRLIWSLNKDNERISKATTSVRQNNSQFAKAFGAALSGFTRGGEKVDKAFRRLKAFQEEHPDEELAEILQTLRVASDILDETRAGLKNTE